MGKFSNRLTITPEANMLLWRRLSRNAFSGTLSTEKTREYFAYFEFDSVEYYPMAVPFWGDHYLGKKNGVYVTMFFINQFKTVGPII